mgnify:CR=1 FL=1
MFINFISRLYIFKKDGKLRFLFFLYKKILIFKSLILFIFYEIFFFILRIIKYDLNFSSIYLSFCNRKILKIRLTKKPISEKVLLR